MGIIQRKHKDRLFLFLFGRGDHKEWTLSLYNAVNGSHYQNAEDITFTTIEDVLYLGMQNDVSFLLYQQMNMYEQQSTYNPNMPLRFLLYGSRLYEKYVEQKNLNIFSSRLLTLPVPRNVVFYNGTEEEPEDTILRLSDSFKPKPPEGKAEIEVSVRMLNINRGYNAKLLGACKPLGEYSWLVAEIRENRKIGMDIEPAVDSALGMMPDSFLIKPLLVGNKAEVKGMVLTEFDEERVLAMTREEGREEGFEDGREKGREEMAFHNAGNLVKKMGLSLEKAMEVLDIPSSKLAELRSHMV